MIPACPLCAAGPATAHHEEAGHRYFRCAACGLVFLHPAPSAGELERLYQEEHGATFHHGAEIAGAFEKRLEASARLRIVRPALDAAPERSALEVGCGAGYLLDRLRKEGWRTAGTELAEGYRRFATEALKLEVSRLPPEGLFGAILAFNVLSHLPDPRAFFSDCRNRLLPGGRLVLETGNAAEVPPERVGPFGAPEHLWHFSEALLRTLLEEAGFTELRIVRRNVEGQRRLLRWLGRRRAAAPPSAGPAPAAPRPPAPAGLLKRGAIRFLLFLRFGLGRWKARPDRFCTLFLTARAP
jgi:SAM-dependent methyltransferase